MSTWERGSVQVSYLNKGCLATDTGHKDILLYDHMEFIFIGTVGNKEEDGSLMSDEWSGNRDKWDGM